MSNRESLMQIALKYSYLLFAATFGLTPRVSSFALVIFLVVNIIFLFTSSDLNTKQTKRIAVLSIPFLVFLYSSFYGYDFRDSLNYLLRASPILLLPIIIGLNASSVGFYKREIIRFYLFGLILSCVISLMIGVFYFFQENMLDHLLYYGLAENLSLHPTYYSLYLVFGLTFLIFGDFCSKRLRLSAIILFIITILLLQSRIAYGVLFLLLLLKLKDTTKTTFKYWIIGFVGIVITLVFVIPESFKRTKEIFPSNDNLSELIGSKYENGVTQRLWLWQKAIEHISERPILGYGLKSQRKVFKWRIHKSNLATGDGLGYDVASLEVATLNLHNQYLHILYESGAIGILLVFLSIVIILHNAVSKKNKIFLIQYCTILIFLFTENLLDRQMGIYFYSFMLPLLYIGQGS